MFIGRSRELESLEKMYAKNSFQMAVVYGRRRIGKTALLNEFIKNKNSLYFSAEEVNDSLNLEKFSRLLGEKLNINNFPTVSSWNNIFSLISEKFKNDQLVLVIDEYPYAANANKSLNSILQHVIDYEFKESNIFLILCGSSLSFMENEVLGEKSPLFGRRTGQLKINPLDYYDSSLFYPDASVEDKIKYYSCFGGTPYYLSLLDKNLNFEENLKEMYFTISGYLFNEGILFTKQEFREPANYNAVLQAISSGANNLGEICGFTKLDSNIVSKYLTVLQNLNFVERRIPFGSNPLKGKTSLYHINENFISFWYKYIFPVRGEIERGNGDIYFQLALDNLPEFIGHKFEEISKQYLRRLNAQNKLPFTAKSFSSWWGKDKKGKAQEIDIVVESMDSKELIVAECKWRNSIDSYKTTKLLKERTDIFEEFKTYKYLFSKAKVETDNEVTNIPVSNFYI